MSRAALRKINVTAGKEAAKGKVPEVERQEESWGNATDEEDQGLRKAGVLQRGGEQCWGRRSRASEGGSLGGREGLWFLIHAGSPGRGWLWGEWNE